MTAAEKSPLACLVLFMICLAAAGSIVAGVHYYAIDVPIQEKASTLQPQNAPVILTKCKNCQLACSYAPNPYTCLDDCDLLC
jgi:hypothetical protein